jgi:hypothetical protein
MSTITATVLPPARNADLAPARKTGPYENWRPPVIGVSLLVPVGADTLVVADLRGLTMMPTGSVHDGQTPEQAAQDVLRGTPNGLPFCGALRWPGSRRGAGRSSLTWWRLSR